VALKSRDWTPAIQDAFLHHLAESANVREAARRIKRSPTTCYARRKTDAAFAEAWDQTMDQAADTVLESEAVRRAVEGVERDVFFQGKRVGSVREYSDTLLIFLLKGWRPERYKDRREVWHAGAISLLRKLEQVGRMTPDELQAFLLEAEQYVNGLEPEGRP
jgi:hypothetical protein